MEIRFYDQNLGFIGLMENQRSMIWTRRFYEPGKMTVCAPLTDDNLRLTRMGNIVWMRGCDEAAVIEDRIITDTPEESKIEISGRFLSSYMDRRLIRPSVSFDGLVEVAMRKLLTDAVPIPRVVLGALNGFTDTVTFQATYKNLMDYETKLSKTSNIGYRFRPDFNAKQIVFETYKGVDRSFGQYINPRVIFSERYDNLSEMDYRENDQLLKTTVYIGGQGEGGDRVFVSFGEEYSGLDRRELYVDARDLTQEEGMSLDEYKQKLLQRGREKVTEYQESQSISCVTDANANFAYKVNYDLGDIVSVRKRDWGITVDLRITEIEEVYENGGMEVHPVLGTPLPQSVDWRDE